MTIDIIICILVTLAGITFLHFLKTLENKFGYDLAYPLKDIKSVFYTVSGGPFVWASLILAKIIVWSIFKKHL